MIMQDSFVNNKVNLLKNDRRLQTCFAFAFLFITLLLIFININMPLVGEDYSLQAWGYNSEPPTLIEKTRILLAYVHDSAQAWSPRIGESFTIILAAFPPIVFDIVNVLMFLWLGVALFMLVYGRFPNIYNAFDDIFYFLVIFFILVLFPLLGQVFFWKAGASNHFWGVTISLSFLLPFRLNLANKIERKNPISIVLFTIFGFVAGMTIENVSATLFFFLLIYYAFASIGKNIDWKFIFPLIANAIGISILLFSPGTAHRRMYYSQLGYDGTLTGINVYVNRFSRIISDLYEITWPLFIVFLVSFLIIIFLKWRKNNPSMVVVNYFKKIHLSLITLFLAACISVGSLITISYQSDQRRGFTFFWLILITLIAYMFTELFRRLPNKATKFLLSILTVILFTQSFFISRSYLRFNHENTARLEIIQQALATGKKTITLPAFTTPDSRVLETREILPDLDIRFAMYYGFEKVVIQKKP